MSVGRMVFDDKPKMRGTYKYLGTHYVLDETIWEIVPIEIN